jgi:hypothetical protein
MHAHLIAITAFVLRAASAALCAPVCSFDIKGDDMVSISKGTQTSPSVGAFP